MEPEFDSYTDQYLRLLQDPLRDFFADGPTFFFQRKWELLREYIHSLGMQPENAAWLDIGCGRGDLLRLGSASFANAVGCDPSVRMLRACSGLRALVQTDQIRLPFCDECFDLVTAVCVYHHVPGRDQPGLTAEVARVLRPGALACIIEHNPYNPVTQFIVRRTTVDAHARLLTPPTVARMFKAAHLEPQRTTYFLYFPERVYKRLRALEKCMEGLPAGGQYAVFARKLRKVPDRIVPN